MATVLMLPVFGVGCGAKDKVEEEASTRPRRMLEADADDVGFIADTLIDFSQGRGKTILNNCYVDGPQITWGSGWHANTSPTLCFRHSGSACVFFADSHADTIPKSKGTITTPSANIGYVGRDNAPHYVPDWRKWF